MNDLREEFAKLASHGYLGDPSGMEAYAYLRASTERQVDEGSSFPRQLENVHNAAKRDKLRITFDMIFFDDGFTGFEFEHRPALLKLRHEVKTAPRAKHIVIEDIDRLSRNADWQQGFLLEELARHHTQVHFFINPGSQLERYVRGYIAQEGMKKDIERMRMGHVYKAMDGRVTAKRPRYGYLITHPKDSHYVLHPEESKVMRAIYEKIIYDGQTLYQIAKWLNDNNIPTRFKPGFWTASTICALVKSPVYKGEFYANRHYRVETGKFNKDGKPKGVMRLRPRSEWIKIDVPAIVTPEEWQLARETMRRNSRRSYRNSKKRNWLLSSLVKCAICEKYTFVGIIGGSERTPIRYYGCNSRNSEKALGLGIACKTPYVRAEELERRVWEEIERVIYDPSVIISRLEEKEREERSMGYQEQMAFIDREIAELAKEQEKFEAAYKRDIYTLDEFEEKMIDLRGRQNTLEVSRAKIETKLAETHSIEEQKHVVISALAKIRAEVDQAKQDKRQPNDIPFAVKRRILTLLADVIWVDSVKRTFAIEGEIKGTFALDEDDSSPPPTFNEGKPGPDFGSTSTR